MAKVIPVSRENLIRVDMLSKPGYHPSDLELRHYHYGEFRWRNGEDDYTVDLRLLKVQLSEVLAKPQFVTPRSDHLKIRVELLIDKIVSYKGIFIRLDTGEIYTVHDPVETINVPFMPIYTQEA